MALLNLLDKISNNIDEKNFNIGIFIDLSNAFDTYNHTIELNKIYCYDVRGVNYDWFKNYLNELKQYVNFRNTINSTPTTVACGVPQRSILGPLLCILTINSITNVSNVLKPILFADDTSLFHTHRKFKSLGPIAETTE